MSEPSVSRSIADSADSAGSGAAPVVRSVADPVAMHALGLELGRRLRAGDLVVLSGPLGAGKTTLTRGIGEALGVRGPITSPTFVLARTHPSLGAVGEGADGVPGPPLVHADAYRLANALELDDLDIDWTGSVVVVEWGAGLLDGVAESWLEVAIARPTGAGDGESSEEPIEPRLVSLTGRGPRWADVKWEP